MGEDKYDEGYDDGYDTGKDIGHADGYAEGYEDGLKEVGDVTLDKYLEELIQEGPDLFVIETVAQALRRHIGESLYLKEKAKEILNFHFGGEF